MDDVLWLSRDLGSGEPTLLWPGRGRSWWRTPEGFAWSDGERLWLERDDRVAVLALGERVTLHAARGRVIAWDEQGRSMRFEGAELIRTWSRRHREGAELRAVRERGRGWRLEVEGYPVALPEGAVDAAEVLPWHTGVGVLWRSDEWVYRYDLVRPPRAIAARSGELRAGPYGAVLLAEHGRLVAGAAPGRSVVALPCPLRDDEWLRFDASGTRVAALDDDGWLVRVDLVANRVLERLEGCLPLDGERTTLDERGTIAGERVMRRGLREHSWALDGRWLAGPGGVGWDLLEGCRLFEAPALHLGATVATWRGWATVDWETGDGHWVGRDGTISEPFRVPVDDDDTIEGGAAIGDTVFVHSSLGRVFAIERDRVRAVEDGPEPHRPARRGDGWRLTRNGLEVRGWPEPFPLPVEAATRVGDRVYAWSTDGLLVAVPLR